MLNLFCLLFSPFSVSHPNAMHREICVIDLSGTTAPRILLFNTNIGYDYLFCERVNQHPHAYHSLSFVYFSFSIIIVFANDFLGTTASKISKFCINIGYNLLSCVGENQHLHVYNSLFLCPFFFFSNKLFRQRFPSSYESQSSHFVYTYEG